MNALALVDPTLSVLAAEINAAHSDAQALSNRAIERAHDAGIRLIQAKAQVEHGQWLPWLAEHCPAVAVRTAQAYMKLAQDWPKLESEIRNGVAHLNFRQVIKLLSAPKPAKPAQKRLPKTPAKCATPVAVLPKPEPQPAKAPVAKLDLSFPPPPPKAKLTPLQEYLAAGDAARRAAGLPVADPIREPDPESLGFIGITAMQRLDGQFNETLDRVFPAPEHVYFQAILRPIEELRDFIPKDVRTTEQAQATVDLLEIITQQARLRLAWLEIHPEPVRPLRGNFGDLVL